MAPGFVDASYWILLGREPDGHARDLARRIESGQPRDAVIRALISSSEFSRRFTDLTDLARERPSLSHLDGPLAGLGTDAEFLSLCYECVLGRSGDDGGWAWHLDQLAQGVPRSISLWTMLSSDEFKSRYAAICPGGSRLPRDVQLCELANPAKWDNPEWHAVLRELRLPAEHRVAMHRKAYEFTQTVWGLRKLGALDSTARILSVGAGHESLLYWLANHVAAVVATDLYQGDWQSQGDLEGDIRVLKHPEEFAPFPYRRECLRFLQMDGTALGLRTDWFDVAYSLSSIEHFGGVAGARAAVEEMARAVRPGGLVVVATEYLVSGPSRDDVFTPDEVAEILAVPSLSLVEPIDGLVWRRYDTVAVDLERTPFETPHMLVRIGETVFTSVLAFLRKA